MWEDVIERTSTAKGLILDTTGRLNAMNAMVGYSDDDGVEFTDEIRAVADKLDQLPLVCAGCGRDKKEDGGELLRCGRCKAELYCSSECQRGLWKVHKKVCFPATET